MFRKLSTFEEAKRLIQERLRPKPLGIEEIPLSEGTDRVLAEDVTANMDIPPFTRSAVDGYAVKAEDTFGAEENRPIMLKVCGTVHIGEIPKIALRRKETAEIVTGAPIPKGADAVVMVEHTEKKGDHVRIFSAIAKNGNVLKAGADITKGETVLKSGRLLGSREVGVLAALGMARVRVYTVPAVAVLSTGAEITEPGKDLSPAKIYDINAYSLSTAVLESGGKPIFLGVFPDNFTELQRALEQGLASADIVVTSGGVSVGPKDVMPKVLASLGKPDLVLSGIAIKPGKPTTVGFVHGKPVFSLPGHPTSALLVFYLLVRPIIQLLAGRGPEENLQAKALAASRIFPAKGRRTFVMVTLRCDRSNRIIAEPVSGGESGAITTLARADGFIEIPENVQFIDTQEEVVVHLFGMKTQRKHQKGSFVK